MKYTIHSTVSVSFRDLDHASALKRFLDEALAIADKGGDFELAVVDGKNIVHRQGIGHDVRKGETKHTIDVERARQEISEARANHQQLQDAIAKINEGFSVISQQAKICPVCSGIRKLWDGVAGIQRDCYACGGLGKLSAV
jgi:hypothetical protein